MSIITIDDNAITGVIDGIVDCCETGTMVLLYFETVLMIMNKRSPHK
jgi:hypothetical protein